MNPEDRALIVAIGQAARTCAMYRELLEVARRYQDTGEVERLSGALAEADIVLSRLIAEALDSNGPEQTEGAGQDDQSEGGPDSDPPPLADGDF